MVLGEKRAAPFGKSKPGLIILNGGVCLILLFNTLHHDLRFKQVFDLKY